MAGIGGLSGSTSSALGGIRGYGGLASGLDRDSLIENMTASTQAKIQSQKQKKQILLWQQEAMRGITDKLYSFQQKFMSYSTPSTNLLSSGFFGQSKITSIGENSKYVSITGNSSMINDITVAGVKQLATTEQLTSTDRVSGEQALKTGEINLSEMVKVSDLAGETIKIKFGSKDYTVRIPSDADGKYDFTNGEDVAKAINEALDNTDTNIDNKLGHYVEASWDEANGKMVFKSANNGAGNTIALIGGSALESLGFKETLPEDGKDITTDGISGNEETTLFTEKTRAEVLAGKKISFSYNGETKWITLDENMNKDWTTDQFAKSLQEKLGEAFGNGRISVEATTNGELSFKTTRPDGTADPSSTLSINVADQGILGKNGALSGVEVGASNRLNTKQSFADYLAQKGQTIDPAAELSFTINGKTIDGLTYGSSIDDIINKINNSNAGVKVSYLSIADKFTLTSTEAGAGHDIKIGNGDIVNQDGNVTGKNTAGIELAALFSGKGKDEVTDTTTGEPVDLATIFNHKDGQDAIVSIKYANSDEIINITRSSNSFNLDGLNVSVSGTFGEYDEITGEVKIDDSQIVSFDAKVDTENIYKTVKEMVDAYNEMIDLVNKTVSTKQNPNDKYAPLTDQQKEDMSEDEIKKWNEKAQVGVLFNNSDLRGLADAMRFVLPGGADWTKLQEFGLTTSNSYGDNGKLLLDETKFKAALESDPAAVQELFTRKEERDVNGIVTKEAGLMQQMNGIYEKYANMTGSRKGILVERAGSTHAPTTILKNGLQTQMDEIQKTLNNLANRLQSEQDRYIKQFTSLETLISQMNSQSSYLSQFGGGY